jgi:hypothetical protein
MNITTTQKSNAAGATKITAVGGGRQKTVSYDHSLSNDQNHGAAVAALILAKREEMGITASIEQIVAHIDAGKATHVGHSTAVHRFSL